jgi:hypothetical protein
MTSKPVWLLPPNNTLLTIHLRSMPKQRARRNSRFDNNGRFVLGISTCTVGNL